MPIDTRRALLFMPGDDRRKIEKGAALFVDSIIMDLEDGVALNHKPTARMTVAVALREVTYGHTERLVRVNPITDDGMYQEDFAATIESRPDGYVIPKVEHAHQLHTVDAILREAETRHGWGANTIVVLAIIESAFGILNVREIASAIPRLQALVFGAEDLAGDIGATRTPNGHEVAYAQSAVVLHAKAYGLQAIDTPFVDLRADDSLLLQESERALQMGYTGKLAIHPRQVQVIQQVFTPTAAQIDRARRLVEVFDAQQANGIGVFLFEGKMIDMPMIRAAQTILKRARAAGIKV